MQKNTSSPKLLIIRFSSFGDIIQTLSIVEAFLSEHPEAEVHWATRSDFVELLEHNPRIKKIWTLERRDGIKGLFRLIDQLKKENFTHIYDAHNNLRSFIMGFFLRPQNFLRRSKDRIKRILLFRFRINLFPKRLTAHDIYIKPLQKWGIPDIPLKESQLVIPPPIYEKVSFQIPFANFIALIPSAAWELKRWPVEYWKELITILENRNFVILGGPGDQFLDELVTPENEHRVLNLRGKLSLLESAAAVKLSSVAVGADTGLTHAADQLGAPVIFLMGPTAFGLPSRPSSKTMEISLWCRPCSKDGRGRCKNKTYKKCLIDIKPASLVPVIHQLESAK